MLNVALLPPSLVTHKDIENAQGEEGNDCDKKVGQGQLRNDRDNKGVRGAE